MSASLPTYPDGYCVSLYRPVRSSCQADVGLGDRRRRASFDWLSERISVRRGCSINRICDTETERKRAQRLLNNPHIKLSDFLNACCLPKQSLSGQELVHVCDQTQLHFHSCLGRLSHDPDELGVVGTGMQFGQNAVVGLLLDAQASVLHGMSSLSFHSRSMFQTSSRQRAKIPGIGRDTRPLSARQSRKWLDAIEECAQRCPQASRITHVIDREADTTNLYLQLYRRQGELSKVSAQHDLLIRLQTNRWVRPCADGRVAPAAVRQQDRRINRCYAGRYVLAIPSDRRCGLSFERDAHYQYHRRLQWTDHRVARQAWVEIHYFQAKMDATKTLAGKSDLPRPMLAELAADSTWFEQLLTFIEVREVASYDTQSGQQLDLPEEQRIHWDLMTTRHLTEAAQVRQMVGLYQGRFSAIEPLFRLLKKQGFQVEATQQRSIHTILKTVAMALKASILALRLVQVRDQPQGYPIEDFFDEKRRAVLQLCQQQYEGQTAVQRNPYSTQQAAWAAWIIACLGGWKPENKKRPPGPITMQRGIKRFEDIFLGVAIAKQWEIDVSQP